MLNAFNNWTLKRNTLRRETINASSFNEYYPQIPLLTDDWYLISDKSISEVRWLFKVRCGLLSLNSKPWNKDGSAAKCTCCNLYLDETTFHFVAECPIFNNARVMFLKKQKLNTVEFQDLCSRTNLKCLVSFLQEALRYRLQLIGEFK